MTQRKKILLVDDSNTAILMHKMILAKEPYDLLTANDGDEAVAKAVSERPDLILMDVVMPRMTGFAACRELRRTEVTKTTPIIMVTTRAEEKVVEAGYQVGCNDYITKPVNGPELLAKVKTFLGN